MIVDVCVSDVLYICPIADKHFEMSFLGGVSLSSTQNVFSVRSAATLDFLFTRFYLSSLSTITLDVVVL